MRHSIFAALLLPSLCLGDYLRDVKPLLTKHCTKCHGGEKQRGGLRLDTAEHALKGGNSGSVILPKNSSKSRLLLAIQGGNDDIRAMPPRGEKLTKQQIALIAKWIDDGAVAPKNEIAQESKKSDHWAFQSIQRPALPSVKGAPSNNPIDRFILAMLQGKGIKPSPRADRVTLIRRVTFDLIGLPPTPAEVQAFLADTRPGAFSRVVERLLASPAYGEKWGRHWLDAARYADSNGFTIDGSRSIWPYRDWVIQSLNRDLPFDQFAIQQLAGDLLSKNREHLVATGFHRNTLFNQEGGIDREQFRVEFVTDRVSTTGTVFLGLTVGCAQCHDHKFDPISQREFYQLFAFFNNVDEPRVSLPSEAQKRKIAEIQKKIALLEKQKKSLDLTSAKGQQQWEKNLSLDDREMLSQDLRIILNLAPNSRSRKQQQRLTQVYQQNDLIKHLTPQPTFVQLAHLKIFLFRNSVNKRIDALKKSQPSIPSTLVMRERSRPRMTHVHIKGDFTRKGAKVSPGTLSVLHSMPKKKDPNRLDLARWMVDEKNPLTARVTINRIWQRYFGFGLVETENDFGTQGTRPSHPKLLDWLASEFMRQKWSMKAMHRLIVSSGTYQRSSHARSDLKLIDPRNRLLSHQNRLRLDAELVRDNALSVSGLLTRKVGGPSVFPPQPKGVYAFTQVKKNWKASVGEDRYRRGLYTHFWRSAPHPGLMAFDAPDSNTTCTRRSRSNTPIQALTLLNDEAYYECARNLALRVMREKESSRLDFLFRVCLAREPSAREKSRLQRYLISQQSSFQQAPSEAKLVLGQAAKKHPAHVQAAWTMVARVVLNLDELITRE